MRIIGNIPRYGRGGNDIYNCTKGKVLLTLITNQDRWLTAVELADSIGVNRSSLFVLLKRWTRPDWHIVRRTKYAGFYHYAISKKGFDYFQRWTSLMPIKRWQQEIQEWQQAHTSRGST